MSMFFQPGGLNYEMGMMMQPDNGGDGVQYQTVAEVLEPVKVAPVSETPPIFDTTQNPVPQTTAAPVVEPVVYTLDQLPIRTSPVPTIGTNPPFYNIPINPVPVSIPTSENTTKQTTEEEENLYFGFTGKQIAIGGGIVGLLAYFATQKGK